MSRRVLFAFALVVSIASWIAAEHISAQTPPVASGFERVTNTDEVPRYILVRKAYRDSLTQMYLTNPARPVREENGFTVTYHRTVEAAVQQLKSQSTSREDLVGLYEVGREINLTHKRTKRKAPDVITEGVETTYEEWSAQ